MTFLNRRPRPISELESSLFDKLYVDEHDSGALLMTVLGIDELIPGYVVVKPLNCDRCWQRRAIEIAELVVAYEKGDA